MSSEHKLNCLLACVHPLRQLSSAAKLCQPCRTTATSWGESIRHLLKLEKHSSPTDYLLYKNQYACLCGVQLNLVCLITHTRACKQLWQEHAERHKSTDINTHFLTHTHSFYRSHWDCVCCVLPDLSMSLSAWVSFFFLSLLFFQAAISARPCHLFSMLWNTALPLAAGVFTRWQKLSIGVKKNPPKHSIQKWFRMLFRLSFGTVEMSSESYCNFILQILCVCVCVNVFVQICVFFTYLYMCAHISFQTFSRFTLSLIIQRRKRKKVLIVVSFLGVKHYFGYVYCLWGCQL